MIWPVPKPRKKRKRAPKGLARSPMKRRANQVPRDRYRMAFVGTYPCVVCTKIGRTQRSKTQADHIRTRGAGGKEVANIWPLCASHHDERHRIGLKSFAYRYNVEPRRIALALEAGFRNQSPTIGTTAGNNLIVATCQ